MPQVKKKKVDSGLSEQARAAKAARKQRGRKKLPYIIASAVIAVVLGILGVAYYQQYVVPFNRVVINYDGNIIRMRYFLTRTRLAGSSGISMLQTLTNEKLIKDGAEKYGILVTPEDVDAQLRSMAAGSDNATVTDAEFKEWYRQLLNEDGVSDSLYKEITYNSLLSTRLQDYLSAQIPAQLEHAHVYGIFVSTYEEALAVKDRVDAGEDFSEVARELSIDQTAENGGELDWMPKGVLVMDQYDPFDLQVGEVSSPLAVISDPNSAPTAYYVLTVKEFETRDVQPSYLPEIRSRNFQDWLAAETKLHEVHWSYNSEIDAWVNWQLSKSSTSTSRASNSSSQTGG